MMQNRIFAASYPVRPAGQVNYFTYTF